MKNKRTIRVYAYQVAPKEPTMPQMFMSMEIVVNTVNLLVKMTGGEATISNPDSPVADNDTVNCEITEEMEKVLETAFPFISIHDRIEF